MAGAGDSEASIGPVGALAYSGDGVTSQSALGWAELMSGRYKKGLVAIIGLSVLVSAAFTWSAGAQQSKLVIDELNFIGMLRVGAIEQHVFVREAGAAG